MATRTIPGRSDDVFILWTDEVEWRQDKPFEGVQQDQAKPPEADEGFRPVPDQLIERYIRIALWRARTEPLEDGSGWFAELPILQGVYGEGESEQEALDLLASAIQAWVLFKMERRHSDIPILADIDLNRG
jgi:predicted RNase H-like HicB family nuclease